MLQQRNVANVPTLYWQNRCAWNYAAAGIRGLRILRQKNFQISTFFVRINCIPPTWRRGFMLRSVRPVHLMHITRRCQRYQSD